MLRSNITGLDSTKGRSHRVLRSRQLRHELDRLRTLHEQFDMAEVDRIIEAASRILTDEESHWEQTTNG